MFRYWRLSKCNYRPLLGLGVRWTSGAVGFYWEIREDGMTVVSLGLGPLYIEIEWLPKESRLIEFLRTH